MSNIHYWKDIAYLKKGTPKQRLTYKALSDCRILTLLQKFDPIVVGTIPIEIDIESSDIDIICYSTDLAYIQEVVRDYFCKKKSFTDKYEGEVYVASFEYNNFEFEVYGENNPTHLQNGFRHMVVEDRILKLLGNDFKNEIVKLKNTGLKTEPAFGVLLHLSDPYKELLELESLSDTELQKKLVF